MFARYQHQYKGARGKTPGNQRNGLLDCHFDLAIVEGDVKTRELKGRPLRDEGSIAGARARSGSRRRCFGSTEQGVLGFNGRGGLANALLLRPAYLAMPWDYIRKLLAI